MLPSIPQIPATREFIDTFVGYQHLMKIPDGACYEEKNLSADHYPLMATRKPRKKVLALTAPGGLIEKDALGYVENGTLYYNFLPTPVTGLTAGIKQLISMGAYICIFPDKVYYNTQDATDYGSMESAFDYTGTVTYTMCHLDGSPLPDDVTISDTAPETTVNGSIWIDTSGTVIVSYQYSSTTGTWEIVQNIYTKVEFTSKGTIPTLFSAYDGVSTAGFHYPALNGSAVIYGIGGREPEDDDEGENDYVILVGLMPEHDFTDTETVSVERKLPELDYVCESNNRLWGCYYGPSENGTLNEIYCSALGDFKNWSKFLGTAADSWTASVGSDGQWTGAVNYLGNPVFFKENWIHEVGVSASGAHSVQATQARGVQKGSWQSLCVVDEILFYKSRTDVCAWQGGFPASVSEALGDEKYYSAVSGVFGSKLYISMKDEHDLWNLFTFDTALKIWNKEDDLHALAFAKVDDELYVATATELIGINGISGDSYPPIDWCYQSGLLYYQYPDMKYISRFSIRLQMDLGSKLAVYIEYDSNGRWIPSGTATIRGTDTVTLPIKPRRCDHMRMMIVGVGNCKIYSIAKILEVGSDV